MNSLIRDQKICLKEFVPSRVICKNVPEKSFELNINEDKVITYWIDKTNLTLERSYPKKVSYIKNTKNTKLKLDDYGTLIIESGSNLFSQIIKNLVRNMTQNMTKYRQSEVKHFMRGIIAGESCVEIHIPSKKYIIHISANDKDEKLIYHNCLKELGIKSIIYRNDKLVISKRENNLKLLQQKQDDNDLPVELGDSVEKADYYLKFDYEIIGSEDNGYKYLYSKKNNMVKYFLKKFETTPSDKLFKNYLKKK